MLGETLAAYGSINNKIVVLDADVSSSTMTSLFAKKYPDRFFNMGIAEPGMIDTAVGLAMGGMIPFASAFAAMLCYRGLEQIRTCVAYNNANVKLLAGYAGVSDFKDGPTHYATFDLAIMRAMPNMTVVVPADDIELKKLLPEVAEFPGPVYFRISRAEVPQYFSENLVVKIGKGQLLKDGIDVTLVVTGTMLHRTIEAHKMLEKEGISARIVEIHTLKPFDEELIIESAEKTGALVTIEEHSKIGGLFGAVAETLASEKPIPVFSVGIEDKFARTTPDLECLWDFVGLSPEIIVKIAKEAIEKKKKIKIGGC
jgi:transketolase